MKEKKKPIKSDLHRLDSMKDENIDYSDIPELDDDFFSQMQVELPKPKEVVTLRLDAEVLDWFKQSGRGYQTRINAVLKSYVKAHENHRNHP